MPAGRFYWFFIAGLLFYFFANQTQTGWLYVVAALLGGVLLASYALNRRMLRAVAARRTFSTAPDDPLHEGADLTITLHVRSQTSAAQIIVTETCPLAAPDSPAHIQHLFIPALAAETAFDYPVMIDRRGLHRFAPLALESRAPFGFFRRKRKLAVPDALLVYPEVRKLEHFSLLDRQPAAELTNPRAGTGSEIIGVRPYRPGDSPRHIHWRGTARHGQLISKEFAEETQPGVTLVLDRYCPLLPLPATKHTPFEMAIKCAVSMAEYALRKGYPLYLAADAEEIAFPQGALVWDALMQYTARVHARPVNALPDVLRYQPLQPFVAVAAAWVSPDLSDALLTLRQRGYQLFVALPDPASFPIDSDSQAEPLVSVLEQAGIDVSIIRHGEDWAAAIGGSSRS